ncbi:MAG: hypothetical protein NTX33_02555 [Propionibacteriales bacterium]|nr:hypothetical protein [Propionibacteriales bacterium]
MTAQIADTIVIDGTQRLLLATPLGTILGAWGLANRWVAPHTANWRGYTAAWSVDADGRLWLDGVSAHVGTGTRETREVHDSEALDGRRLPLFADFVTGQLRVAAGDPIRYVHMGFETVWSDEMLIDVVEGRVTGRQQLAPPGAMGNAGPYRLQEPLLAGLSGGAFGQLIAAEDVDGAPLVAKAPRRTGGGMSNTSAWMDTPAGRRPTHLPAVGYDVAAARRTVAEVGLEETQAILLAEAAILEKDGGVLLPRSLGLWTHDRSGLDVLVMEQLEGRRPQTVGEVVAVLEALVAAVERGTFDHHGDVKAEHVFIGPAGVRLCDPAPRLPRPGWRAFTEAYNPRGWSGPAADAAGCATLLRYLPIEGAVGWRWCAALLDGEQLPAWAQNHAGALAALRADLEAPAPLPPGWVRPAFPGDFTVASVPPSPPPPVDVAEQPAGTYGFAGPAPVGHEDVVSAAGRGHSSCHALREAYGEAATRVAELEGPAHRARPGQSEWRWEVEGPLGRHVRWVAVHEGRPDGVPGFRPDLCPSWTSTVLVEGSFSSGPTDQSGA